jgi:hypothetical protein
LRYPRSTGGGSAFGKVRVTVSRTAFHAELLDSTDTSLGATTLRGTIRDDRIVVVAVSHATDDAERKLNATED